jgi:hypothetical protein
MRITVVGVLIIIGTIVAVAVIADQIVKNINRNQETGNDQTNPES